MGLTSSSAASGSPLKHIDGPPFSFAMIGVPDVVTTLFPMRSRSLKVHTVGRCAQPVAIQHTSKAKSIGQRILRRLPDFGAPG